MRRTFRDKAWFVQLEDLRDESLVPDAVIEQLGQYIYRQSMQAEPKAS